MFDYSSLKVAHLEITSRCQASCPMCPRNYHGGLPNNNLKINDWSYEDFQKIFTPDVLQQMTFIFFCGNYGDPIINNDLLTMCKHVKDTAPHVKIHIHTNGGARNSAWWKQLKECLPTDHKVLFAIDGLEDTHHLYRIGTTYKKVISNAKNFIDAGGTAEWVFIKFKHNEHQVSEAKRRSNELGFDQFTVKNTTRFIGKNTFEVLDSTGTEIYHLEPPSDNSMKLIDQSVIDEFYYIADDVEIECKAKTEEAIYIDAHLDVYPCCFLATTKQSHNRPREIVKNFHSRIKKEIDIVFNKIENFNAGTHTLEEIINSKVWQTIWNKSWRSHRLIKCAVTCGKNLNFSKNSEQIIISDRRND